MMIDDDHPIWNERDGGAGHHDHAWQADDLAQARTYYEALAGPAREIFDYLRATPGRLVSCDEIADRLHLNPDGTKNNPHVVAGRMTTAGRARKDAGRCFPFHWWKTESGAQYAVKHSVAAVFEAALGPPKP